MTQPKSIRQSLHLEPGVTLRLEADGDQITLQPVRVSAPICKEGGIWVYRSGQANSLSIRKLVKEGRDERNVKNLGLDTTRPS